MKEITETDRTALRNFFGGYFHQYFVLDYSSWEEAVSQFQKDAGEKSEKELIEALERFYASDLGEKKIEKMITDEFFCFVWPVKGRGRTWIRMILKLLKKELPNKAVEATSA